MAFFKATLMAFAVIAAANIAMANTSSSALKELEAKTHEEIQENMRDQFSKEQNRKSELIRKVIVIKGEAETIQVQDANPMIATQKVKATQVNKQTDLDRLLEKELSALDE